MLGELLRRKVILFFILNPISVEFSFLLGNGAD